MKKKKLLIVTSFDYEGTRWGRNFPLARAFVRNGFEVTMLVTEKRNSLKPYIVKYTEGVRVVCFNAILPSKIRQLPIGIFTTSFFSRLIYAVSHKFDVVYSDCGEMPCAGWPCLINKWIYKSKYLSEYGDLLGKGGFYDMKPKLYKLLFGFYYLWSIEYFRKKSDYVIVLSNIMGQYVNQVMGVTQERIILVPGGSITDKVEFILHEKDNNTPIYLGFIGSDDYEVRGMLPLLKIINQKYRGKFIVKLYGDKLSDTIIKENSLSESIIECGWIDVISGQDEIRKVDIFILMKENLGTAVMGWPNKLGDYLSYGRPIIITPYGDLCDFVTNNPEGFIVVDRNNEIDLERKLADILEGRIDLIEMSRKNRMIAENVISWDARIKKIVKLL